ncbi:MAG TPA: hypothetical protein VKS60_26315 [Stellaceae bacterium]|nr:hypothetical protein [Stellaceae bacterium]
MTSNRLLPFGLAGVAALIGLALLVEFLVPWSPSHDESQPAALPDAAGLASPIVPATVTDLAERPLFTATRRPQPASAALPPEPVKPVAPPPEPATTLTLLGIVGDPAARIAVIRVQNTPVPVRVTEGAKIDRWEVRQIFADHLTLVSGGTVQELGFPEGGGRPGTIRASGTKH